jgi:hypothetical protein
METNDIELLSAHGWEIVSLSPLVIEHLTSGQLANGTIAMMVLQMIKDGVVSFL